MIIITLLLLFAFSNVFSAPVCPTDPATMKQICSSQMTNENCYQTVGISNSWTCVQPSTGLRPVFCTFAINCKWVGDNCGACISLSNPDQSISNECVFMTNSTTTFYYSQELPVSCNNTDSNCFNSVYVKASFAGTSIVCMSISLLSTMIVIVLMF